METIPTTEPNCWFSMFSLNGRTQHVMKCGTLKTDSDKNQLTLTYTAWGETHTVVFDSEPSINNGALVFDVDRGGATQTFYIRF